MADVHDVFHMSWLKKCLRVLEEQLPMKDLNVQEDLTYIEQLVEILEMAERSTQRKVVRICKVRWSHHMADEAI